MKVSPTTKPAGSRTLEANAPVKSSSSFDRILKMKEAEAERDRKRQPTKDGQAEDLVSDSSVASWPVVSPAQAENSKSSHAASSAGAVVGTQIQNIAGEIVSQIRSATNKDGSRSVEIEFNSKTLEGLQVRIREQGGTLSIQFATQSEQVATILADHKSELISALASDGFKTASVSTLVHSKQSAS